MADMNTDTGTKVVRLSPVDPELGVLRIHTGVRGGVAVFWGGCNCGRWATIPKGLVWDTRSKFLLWPK